MVAGSNLHRIEALKKFRLSYLLALIPLVVVIGVRLILAIRTKKFVVRPKLDKTIVALILLLIAAGPTSSPANGRSMAIRGFAC
jgi:hypothetical protein